MVFDIRGPYDDLTPDSFTKKNFMQVISGRGSDLNGLTLNPKTYTLAFCTLSESGFIVNHLYLAKEDLTGWIDVTQLFAHTHSGSSDGGDFIDILRANPKEIDTGFMFMDKACSLLKSAFVETVSGTGSTADDTTSNESSLKLATGATSGSGATLSKTSNQKIDFSKPSHFQFYSKLSNIADIAMKLGTNCETVTASDDSTVKYEAQICRAVNANWNVRTADGSAHSEADTGIALTTSQTSVRLEHFPNLSPAKVDTYIDTANAFTKSASNIPVSGNSALTALMKFSLKNTIGSDRQCFIYGIRVRFYTASQWK